MSITWNGVSSDTIGVIVERIPNRYVPTRRFSPQQVAGRNGNILLVDKSFPNVEQEYEVYLSAEAQGLPSVARACAEWLMGPDGYCRLQDSYDTTVYREAFLMGGYDLENILNKFGRCTITFSCKPQKYLLTGDTPIEIPAGITTYTGDVVQFDGVTGASITSLSTTITPTQDLHGYANPWPAGGGKNKIDTRNINFTTAGITATSDADGIISLTGTRDASTGWKTIASYNLPAGNYVFSSSNPHITCLVNWTHKPGTFTVVDGDVVRLALNGMATGDVINDTGIKVQIESGSTATSWEPYSNICPISGRTGVSVYRTGANLNTDTWTRGNLTGTGQTTSGNYAERSVFIPCLPNTTYYLHASIDLNLKMFGYTSNSGNPSASTIGSTVFGKTASITTGASDAYIRCVVWYTDTSLTISYADFSPVVIGTGTTYAVDWTSEAGTVYGGTLDVVTGVLTVDRAMVDMGTLTWSYANSIFVATLPSDSYNYASSVNALSDCYAFVGTIQNGTFDMQGKADCSFALYYNANYPTSRMVYVKNTAYTDAAAFKTAMDGHQLCYELDTPLTYQLTAQEIEVLVGENNVWTSSGPVSVTVEAPCGGTVTNPTPFEARPMLEVSGVGEITINGKTIQILEAVSDFNIDCESMEAEDNSKIYCIDFPELSGGENEIAGDGSITALTVTPRWWTL